MVLIKPSAARRGLAALALSLTVCAAHSQEAESGKQANALAFLDAYVGAWLPHPESPFLKEHPERADDIAFLFEWAGEDRKILRFYEGIPNGDKARRILETLVTFDPRDGTVLFLGHQVRNGFLYRGSFESLADGAGFRRLYDVTYPPGTEFHDAEDRARGWIRYRDTCRLTAPDTLHCVTEQHSAGAWRPWGRPEGYRLVRR